MRNLGATEEQLGQLADEHISQFPNAPNADFIRWYMLTQEREKRLQGLVLTSQPQP